MALFLPKLQVSELYARNLALGAGDARGLRKDQLSVKKHPVKDKG